MVNTNFSPEKEKGEDGNLTIHRKVGVLLPCHGWAPYTLFFVEILAVKSLSVAAYREAVKSVSRYAAREKSASRCRNNPSVEVRAWVCASLEWYRGPFRPQKCRKTENHCFNSPTQSGRYPPTRRTLKGHNRTDCDSRQPPPTFVRGAIPECRKP